MSTRLKKVMISNQKFMVKQDVTFTKSISLDNVWSSMSAINFLKQKETLEKVQNLLKSINKETRTP